MAEVETSSYVLCECKGLSTLRHAYLGFFFLDLGNVRGLNLGAIWNFVKRTGLLPSLGLQSKGHKRIIKGLPKSGSKGLEPIIYHSANQGQYLVRMCEGCFLLTLRRLMSYIYGAPILDVSRSHTTTQHSR